MDSLSSAFAALADPTRRAILSRLARGEARVGELGQPFQMSAPAISRHLRVLRTAHLVREEPLGRERIYRLDAVGLQPVSGWLEGYRAFWHQSLGNLKALLEGAQAPLPEPAPPVRAEGKRTASATRKPQRKTNPRKPR